MNNKGIIALLICAAVALVTAFAHLSCIFLGPECFKAQLAPPVLVESSINGTLLAPVATAAVSALFILCALFSFSAIGAIKKLPLTYFALAFLAFLCTLRGLATIPLSLTFHDMVSTYSIAAGFTWFIVGLLYAYGFMQYRKDMA